MPRRQPPPGTITATEAIKRIGKSLYKYVDKGLLHPQGPATLKHKYYLESEVASIEAQEKAAFEAKFSKMPARFERTRPSDAEGIYNLAVKIFGGPGISADKRREWIETETRGNYVVKRNDTNEVVAYLYVQSLSHQRIERYLKECRGSTVTKEEIRRIEPGTTHEMVIGAIGREPRADKQYTAVLIHGFLQDLETWAREGIEISHFYGYSETVDGIYLSLTMGMKLLGRPRYIDGEGPFFKFVLDVEKTDIPILRPYKRALAQWKQSHQKEIVTQP